MASINDGGQNFGVTAAVASYIIESFSITSSATRVDVANEDGSPRGENYIQQRDTISATMLVPSSGTIPEVGNATSGEISVTPTGGSATTFILTDVTLNETQADYQRFTVSGYEEIGS